MGISFNPSETADPIMDGAIQIAVCLNERSAASIESIRCKNNGNTAFITVTDEDSAKLEYLLIPVDKSRKERNELVFEARVEREVAARMKEVHAVHANGVTGDGMLMGGQLRAQDLASYCFDTDAPIEDDQVIYDGFLSVSDLGVWIGREKARKSNYGLVLAISAALGRDFLGFQFMAKTPLRIVIIDYESKNGSLKKRYDSIADAMKLSIEERALLKQNLTVIEVRRIRKAGIKLPKFPYKPDPEALKFWEALVAANPADLYLIDPLRSLHSGDENDSAIESMLTEMQRVFRGATLIVIHHMRKAGDNAKMFKLADDMRAWSDGVRGSSAIKASADVIVCQEWMKEPNGDEVVHLGAFLKDGADIEPFPLMETDKGSYFWDRIEEIPLRLSPAVNALGIGTWANKSAVADIIRKGTGVARATAFRYVDEMLRAKIITELPGGTLTRKRESANDLAA